MTAGAGERVEVALRRLASVDLQNVVLGYWERDFLKRLGTIFWTPPKVVKEYDLNLIQLAWLEQTAERYGAPA